MSATILSRLSREPWAIVSAERTEFDTAENHRRTLSLRAALAADVRVELLVAYGVAVDGLDHANDLPEIIGRYDGIEERSYLIFGSRALRLAREYGAAYSQETILTPAGLEYVTGEHRGKLHPSKGISAGTDPNFQSIVVETGESFVAEIDFDTLEEA